MCTDEQTDGRTYTQMDRLTKRQMDKVILLYPKTLFSGGGGGGGGVYNSKRSNSDRCFNFSSVK